MRRGSISIRSFVISAIAVALLSYFFVSPVHAVPVTVKQISVSPYRIAHVEIGTFYSGGVYAGVVNLQVDGVAMQGFCIDPFHFASKSALTYEMVPLEDAPKAYLPDFLGAMGNFKADQISKLMGMAYSPNMYPNAAAGLQIAIWEIVAGEDFKIITTTQDFGAADLLAQLPNYKGPKANLIALTGPGQDYVIATVPDGGATAALLGLGLAWLAFAGRKLS